MGWVVWIGDGDCIDVAKAPDAEDFVLCLWRWLGTVRVGAQSEVSSEIS